jgi:hypothetical protein
MPVSVDLRSTTMATALPNVSPYEGLAAIAAAAAGVASVVVALVALRFQARGALRATYLNELRLRREQWDGDKWRAIRKTAAQSILQQQQDQATAELELFLNQAAICAEKAGVPDRELDIVLPDHAFEFWAAAKGLVHQRGLFERKGRGPLDRIMIRQYRSWYSWFDWWFTHHALRTNYQIMLYIPQEAGWQMRSDYINPLAIADGPSGQICTYTLRVRGQRSRRKALLSALGNLQEVGIRPPAVTEDVPGYSRIAIRSQKPIDEGLVAKLCRDVGLSMVEFRKLDEA